MTITTHFIIRLARRALRLHIIKACAVIATLYAKAPAAPKRGGGMPQTLQVDTMLSSRLPLSGGAT